MVACHFRLLGMDEIGTLLLQAQTTRVSVPQWSRWRAKIKSRGAMKTLIQHCRDAVDGPLGQMTNVLLG